mgnify:CR=1 FL=1
MSKFGDKFKAERAKQGPGKTFEHNGKSYSTNVDGEKGSSGSNSFGSKIMGGIKAAGNQIKADFQHGTNKDFGTTTSRAAYDARNTAARDRLTSDPFHANSNANEGAADQMASAAAGAAPVNMTKTYADNLKRYNDYMESQKQPPPTEITPDMRNAALSMFESQQGAGQVPYTMAAARNSTDPNMSPAFQYAAQNYDVLGGSQRLAPRPMEMMSVAERNRINDMSQAMANSQPQPTPYAPNYMPQPNINFGPPPPPTPQMNEGQQYEMFKQLMSGQGGKGNAPTEAQPTQSDFGRMLAARFGGGNQGGGGFGF